MEILTPIKVLIDVAITIYETHVAIFTAIINLFGG